MEEPTGPQPESLTERGSVGYGRPPLASRWKAGQSGNPQGRRPKVTVTPVQPSPDSETETKVGSRKPPRPNRRKPGQSDKLGGSGPRRSKAKLVTRSDEAASPPETETKVGYRQPPLHSRWKLGQTGNPVGKRPRDILQEVLLSPFPVKIGAKIEMAPAIDVMLLRIRARALEGDQEVIRSLIEHFGSTKFAKKLVRRSSK